MARKIKGKGSGAAQPTSHKCIIGSEVALGKACAEALRQQLDGGHIVSERKVHKDGAQTLHFTANPPVKALLRGDERPVLQLDERRWLHLAINLDFIAKGQWRLKHISIDVLEGEATDLGKKSLLRAEWMMHETSESDGHAQPHWHAIGAAGVDQPEDFEAFLDESADFGDFLASGTKQTHSVEFKHFHYAMITGWHRAPQHGHCHVLEDQDAAVSWISGCVDYIRHQLEHVSKKSGKSA